MADKGIIFSAPMVRALLDGRKTQTRRLLTSARVFGTPEARSFTLKGDDLARALQGADRWRHLGGDGWFWESDAFDYQAPAERTGWMAHLPYAPCDRLYVREAYSEGTAVRYPDRRKGVFYRADLPDTEPPAPMPGQPITSKRLLWVTVPRPFHPSIHMPRWASRLWLEVTDVRVQRLQDMSEADAQCEGLHHRNWEVESGDDMEICEGWSSDRFHAFKHGIGETAREGFELLWDSLHTTAGERWQDNPWIVAVSFTVHQGNIDGRCQ